MNTPQEALFSELSISEQRESLQEVNPDMLAGVFNLQGKNEGSRGYNLLNIENVLACYPNQIEEKIVKLPDGFENGDIVIINMGSLRNGNIEVIAGNEKNLPIEGQRDDLISEITNPVLLSPGVIEYWEGENGKRYTQTTLRDTGGKKVEGGIKGLADATARTTVAGRNFTGRLHEDLEMENSEESPFLMQDKDGNFVLVTHDLDYVKYLKGSIKKYLEDKFLTDGDENYDLAKKLFEGRFKGVKYDDLGKILEDIVENNRFQTYDYKEGEIDGVKNEQITLGSETGEFYIFHDEDNNTIEYRSIREITGFPEGLRSVGRIPLRLFLESENQDPSFKKVDNIGKYGAKNFKTLVPQLGEDGKQIVKDGEPQLKPQVSLVPLIDDFARKVHSVSNLNTSTKTNSLVGIYELGKKKLGFTVIESKYLEVDMTITQESHLKRALQHPDQEIKSLQLLEKDGRFILKIIYFNWQSPGGSSPYPGNDKTSYYDLESQ